jgi:iron complex outermembrane receptor protein
MCRTLAAAARLIAVASLTAPLALPAQAQIEDIVITAERREASLQETPISISAFTGDDLVQNGIQDTEQLTGFTPGLVIQRDVIGKVVIRGVGTENFTVAGDPGVAVSVDGAYISRSNVAIFDLFDMERVEVLRGPQGTLYGRNATGGAINFITRKPTEETETRFQVDVGNYNKFRAEAAVSGSITENGGLRGRVAGMVHKRDGFTENVFPSVGRGLEELDTKDLWALRGQLAWTAGNVDFNLSGDYYKDESRPIPYKYTDDPITSSTFGDLANPLAGQLRTVSQGFESDVPGTSRTLGAAGLWEQGGVNLTIDWALSDDVALRSITAFRNFQFQWINDGDGVEDFAVNYAQDDDSDLITQEIQLFSTTDSAFSWIGGLYFLGEESTTKIDIPIAPFFSGVFNDGTAETTAAAIFGQVSWDFTDSLRLNLGARYSYEEKEVDYVNNVFGGLTPIQEKNDWDAFTPKIGLDWFVSDDVMLFGSITQGFKSGGFNLLAAQGSFDQEDVTSLEVGTKGAYFDGRMQLNASVFYYDYQDLQVGKVVNLSAVIENAAEASIYGAEIELKTLITDNFSVDAGLSLLKTEYDKFLTEDPGLPTGTGEIDLAGNALPRAPEYQGFISALYSFPLNGGATIDLWGNFQFTDEQFFTQFNRPNVAQGSYQVLNAKLSYISGDGRWRITLFGDNLTEEDYFTNALESGVPTPGVDAVLPQYFVGAPRTYGLQVSYQTN